MENVAQVAETPLIIEETPVIADQNAAPAPQAIDDRPKPDAVQRRIDRLTREKYQSRAETEMLRREVEALRARQEQPRQEAPATAEPKLEQFSNFEDFIAARDKFLERKFDERLTARERQEQEAQRAREAAKVTESWSKRMADIRKEVPDYDDVIEAADVQVGQTLAQAITESDMGPRILLHLANHPEEAEALNGLSQSATLRALGRIEAKIEAEGSKKEISSAPKPVKPVTGAGAGVANGPSDTQSMDEWLRARNKQLGRK